MREVDVYLKRQKLRRVASQFVAYLGGNASTEFALPADSDIYGRSAAPLTTAEDFTVSVNGVNRAAPDVAADTVFRIGRFVKGTLLQAMSGVELLINAGLGRYVSIGSPPVPVVSSDFKNGIYSIGGVSKVLSDLWVQNAAWSGYNASDVIAGVGLRSVGTVGGTFVGPILTALAETGLLNGYVAVLEYTLVRGAGQAYVGVELNELPGYANEYTFAVGGTGSGYTYSVGDFNASSLNSAPLSTKAAVRLAAGSFAASLNGAGYVENTGIGNTSGMNTVALFCNTIDATGVATVVLEKIEFFALADYSVNDLPLLSH